MALEGLSADQQAALAEIVAPETLVDIEEYIRPQFPPRRVSLKDDFSATATIVPVKTEVYSRRRIVQDGHGRWREVRPQMYSGNLQTPCSRNLKAPMKVNKESSFLHWTKGSYRERPNSKLVRSGNDVFMNAKDDFGDEIFAGQDIRPGKEQSQLEVMKHHGRSRHHSNGSSSHLLVSSNGNKMGTSSAIYDDISMATRSNVFPGLGNNRWYSTTSNAFTEQVVTPPAHRAKFFGMKTDGLGKWSAANVHHERMKKKWDEYLHALPKQAAAWKPQEATQIIPKVEKPPPQPKVKKPNPKPKPKNKEEPPPSSQEAVVSQDNQNPPEKPPIEIPVDDEDDNTFWDFYNKPFNKPN